MKILVVSPKFHPIIGGGETFVLNQMRNLHNNGYDVSIAVEPNIKRNTNDYPFKVYEIEGLSDSNLDVIKGTSNLHKLIKKIKPDIIHAHGYFALLCIGLTDNINMPIVASIHSTPVWGERLIGGMGSFEAELNFARKVLNLSKPRIVTAANEVYAVAARKVVQEKYKVKVLPYPVDTLLFSHTSNAIKRAEFKLDPTDRLILLPSRIIERKGIKEAVFALDLLPDNFYLCLPAAVKPLDPKYWEELCSTKEYVNVRKRIIIPSKEISYFDMPNLYGAADIVAMPSYYEGAPVATVEAMASGKPFVGADSQGINSFIVDNKNGLLVPQKNHEELARAILKISRNRTLGQRLSKNARNDILKLSWTNILPDIISMYEEILDIDKVFNFVVN